MAKSVFISSTSRDLPEYRAAVDKAIRRLELRPVNMDDFGSRSGGASRVSLSEVKKGDIFVGIIAKRYGTIQPGHEKSITEEEYDEAIRLNRPRLMYLVDSTYNWPADRVEADETAQRKLAAFIARVEQDEVRSLFTTPEDLAFKVTADITKLLDKEQQRQFITRILTTLAVITAILAGVLLVDPTLRGRALVIAGLATSTPIPSATTTPTNTPTITPTPTATFTPTNTSTATNTYTPTATFTPSITPTPTATPLEGTPFADMKDKIGIVLADFERIDPIQTDVEKNLEFALKNAGIPYIRVKHSISDNAEAKQIREQYNAAIIIWGQVATGGVRTYVNKVPCTCPGDPDFNSIEVQTTGANPVESYVFNGANIGYITEFTHGQIEYFNNNYDEAIGHFDKAESQIGDQSGALHADLLYYFRGTTWYEKGKYGDKKDSKQSDEDYDKAIEDFNRALALNTHFAEAYYGRAKVYHTKKSDDLALADFAKAIELNPNLVAAYTERGDFYRNLKQYDLALADYNKAIELQPDYYYRYWGRAYLYTDQKQYDLALTDFSKIIELDPKDADAYGWRAYVYQQLAQSDLAIADRTKAIELDPTNADRYKSRGYLYSDLKQYDLALTDFSKAIELDPKDADAYGWRAYVYQQLAQSDLAIADRTKAIELDPTNADRYMSRGYLYSDLKQYDLALTDFSKAIELDPKDADAYEWRAISYEYQSKPNLELAIADANKAIELAPDKTSVHWRRGYINVDRKQFDLALEDFSKVIELDSGNAGAYLWRAYVYRNLPKPNQDLALADLNKAIELDPQYTNAYNDRANLYYDQKKYDLALPDYKRSIELAGDSAEQYIKDRIAEIESKYVTPTPSK